VRHLSSLGFVSLAVALAATAQPQPAEKVSPAAVDAIFRGVAQPAMPVSSDASALNSALARG